ncbi:MAG: hypothetical protein Greene07147_386 [Parcubacteria group bacterium Greene0714_7]|nr:MAG: hypothetical protein Greene07147_386 [Parcubacteria group bacterium Greene0714_7]
MSTAEGGLTEGGLKRAITRHYVGIARTDPSGWAGVRPRMQEYVTGLVERYGSLVGASDRSAGFQAALRIFK